MAQQRLQVGVVVLPTHAKELSHTARVAEHHGFDLIGLGDSQSVARELYASLSVVAQATSRIRLGPTVTNLQTRHPAVTASAIATVDEVSEGRAFLGLGSGDSSVYSLGLGATPLRRLREGIVCVRALLSGEPCEWDGAECQVHWLRRSVPILLTLRAAGELADGVILGGGIDQSSVATAMRNIEAGLERSGRSRADLEVWSFAKVGLAATREEALGPIKVSLAAAANHTFRHGFADKDVAVELIPRIEALREAYAYRDHDQPDGRNDALTDRFGLTDWLTDRFAVAGSPEDCIATLDRLAASGVDGVLVAALFEDAAGFIEEFGRTVLRPFRERERGSV